MDTDSSEGRDYERDWLAAIRGAKLLAQRAREQSHNPVLGGDTIRHHHHDTRNDHHNYIDTHNHGDRHHHHGPIDNDIIEHTHDNNEPWHDHFIADFDNNDYHVIDLDKQFYGTADHTHDDTERATPDGSKRDGLRDSWHGSPVDGRLRAGSGKG